MIEQSLDVLRATRNCVDALAKQSKTFKNLVVITAVEVARINDENLSSVVVSMKQTEGQLNELIEKLYINIGMWDALRSDFMSTFSSAEKDMSMLCRSDAANDREKVLSNTHELDEQLDKFKGVFLADKYISSFDSSTLKLVDLFSEFNESMQEIFMEFNNHLGDSILSDDEFTRGRNEAEIKEILAEEDGQSGVEFF